MKVNFKHIIKLLFLLLIISTNAQETINANDPNSFVTGGGQEFQSSTIELLPVAIIDIEGFSGFNPGISTGTLEAGLPVSGGTSDLSNIWLNFTYRSVSYQPARILVYTNLPVPNSVQIEVQIDVNNYGTEGDFPKNPNSNKINVNEIEQVIVYDFANGYTGNGVGNGYKLIYTITNPSGVSFPEGFEILYRIQ